MCVPSERHVDGCRSGEIRTRSQASPSRRVSRISARRVGLPSARRARPSGQTWWFRRQDSPATSRRARRRWSTDPRQRIARARRSTGLEDAASSTAGPLEKEQRVPHYSLHATERRGHRSSLLMRRPRVIRRRDGRRARSRAGAVRLARAPPRVAFVVATRRICGLVAAAFDAHGRGCGGYGPRLSAMIVGDAAAGRVASTPLWSATATPLCFATTAKPPRRTRFAGFEVSAVWAARAAAPVA